VVNGRLSTRFLHYTHPNRKLRRERNGPNPAVTNTTSKTKQLLGSTPNINLKLRINME
jgi:hypothetical protein